jgi:hypothetical protein
MGTRNIIIASDLCSMGPELHARTLYTPACMPDNKGPVATGVPPGSTRSSDRTGLSSNLCRLNDTLACLAKHSDLFRSKINFASTLCAGRTALAVDHAEQPND